MRWFKKIKCLVGQHEYGGVYSRSSTLCISCAHCCKIKEVKFSEKDLEAGVLAGALDPYFKTLANRFEPKGPTEKKIKRELESIFWDNLRPIACVLPDTKEGFDIMWNQNFFHVYSSKFKHRVHNTASGMITDYVLRPYGKSRGWI